MEKNCVIYAFNNALLNTWNILQCILNKKYTHILNNYKNTFLTSNKDNTLEIGTNMSSNDFILFKLTLELVLTCEDSIFSKSSLSQMFFTVVDRMLFPILITVFTQSKYIYTREKDKELSLKKFRFIPLQPKFSITPL